MIVFDTDQDNQISWEEFATLLKPPEDEFGQLEIKVKRDDLPEKIEAHGKEELQEERKRMNKQAELVDLEEKQAAEQEKEDQKRWRMKFDEEQAWEKKNPRAQWLSHSHYSIAFDFFKGDPPAKLTTLGICTTKEDHMLLEAAAHLHLRTDLRVQDETGGMPSLKRMPSRPAGNGGTDRGRLNRYRSEGFP